MAPVTEVFFTSLILAAWTPPISGCMQHPAPCNGRLATVWPARPGDVATFSCDPGFQLSGSSTRECQQDGEWSGTNPICERVRCPEPGEPAHGFRDEHLVFQYMDVVTFTCEPGYHLRGHSQIICLASQTWFGPVPTCEVNPMNIDDTSLGADVAPDNGGLVCYKDRTSYALLCAMRCNPGFEFPAAATDFEVLGPQTVDDWMPQCVEAFMPGVTLEAPISYFPTTCNSLDDDAIAAAKTDMASILNESHRCPDGICDTSEMYIACGREIGS